MDDALNPIDNLHLFFRRLKGISQKTKSYRSRSPVVNARKEEDYQAALAVRAPFLPKIDNCDRHIVSCLQQTGTYTMLIEKLELATTKAMLEKASELSKILQKTAIRNDLYGFSVSLNEHQTIDYPDIFLWGLETKLLDIVENYLGLPVIYRGASLRRDLPEGETRGIRQWHLDREDRRTIKIIIYLNDVDENSSPYEYISQELTSTTLQNIDYYNFDSAIDKIVNSAVLKSQWKAITGEAGTMIFTDMSNTLHRLKPQAKRERFSLTFSYTSNLAPDSWQIAKFSPEQWQQIETKLSKRQKRCLIL